MSETGLEYSAVLGRRVRTGNWQDQAVSTYSKIQDALDQEAWRWAAELANYFVEEASVCFGIYRGWIPLLNDFLAENGCSSHDLDVINADIVSKLRLPDGRAWDPHRQWHDVGMLGERLVAAVHDHDAQKARALLDELKETWRRCHDRDVDHTYGLMSEIVKRCGEDRLGEAFGDVLTRKLG